MQGVNSDAGKGDSYRKVDPKKWSENYDAIFRKSKKTKIKKTKEGANECQRMTTDAQNVNIGLSRFL